MTDYLAPVTTATGDIMVRYNDSHIIDEITDVLDRGVFKVLMENGAPELVNAACFGLSDEGDIYDTFTPNGFNSQPLMMINVPTAKNPVAGAHISVHQALPKKDVVHKLLVRVSFPEYFEIYILPDESLLFLLIDNLRSIIKLTSDPQSQFIWKKYCKDSIKH